MMETICNALPVEKNTLGYTGKWLLICLIYAVGVIINDNSRN